MAGVEYPRWLLAQEVAGVEISSGDGDEPTQRLRLAQWEIKETGVKSVVLLA